MVRGVILLTALGLAALAPEPAGAEPRDACARGTRFRGKKIDIDLKDADLHDAFRLLADVGRANLVVPDDVRGTVTIRVRATPWDQVMCSIARLEQLDVELDQGVYTITPRR